MSKKKLTELNDQELKQQEKFRKMSLGVMIGLVVVMFGISISRILNDEITNTTYVPLFFVPIILVFWYELKKVQKEIKSRNL